MYFDMRFDLNMAYVGYKPFIVLLLYFFYLFVCVNISVVSRIQLVGVYKGMKGFSE